MEDENEIELSLGLSCGSSSGKAKVKGISLDPKVDIASGYKSGCLSASGAPCEHFYGVNNEKHEVGGLSSNPRENFWADLKVPSQGLDAPLGVGTHHTRSYQGLWSKSSSNKRKFTYEENWQQKKHEGEAEAKHEGKSPHVPVTVEDGSSAENEGVAESEAEGPTSRHSFGQGESTRQYMTDGYNVPKKVEIQGIVKTHVSDTYRQKQDNAVKNGGSAQGGTSQSSMLPMTLMSPPYTLPATASSNAASSLLKNQVSSSSTEHCAFQAVNASNLQRFFGHSAVQLSTVEQFSAYSSQCLCGGRPNGDPSEGVLNLPRGDRKLKGYAKGNKQPLSEEAGTSSPRRQDESGGFLVTTASKDYSEQPSTEGFPFPNDGSVIRPGIAANVKFGGCGTCPDLPWVSTTGTGPNGRTISGVTYRYGKNQIRIVCACHGSHLSPEEFVRHASVESTTTENNPAVASLPNTSAASAQG